MPGLVTLIIGSLVILAYSISSLRHPGAHGYYRFFAWEFILLQFCTILKLWFNQPIAWHQLVSWFLLILSIPVLVLGVRTFRKHGQAQGNFEATTRLVEVGIYRYIRHPMYASLFYLSWGIFFKSLSWLSLLLMALANLSLWLTARADERECLARFGDEYDSYMRRTKKFIPFIL